MIFRFFHASPTPSPCVGAFLMHARSPPLCQNRENWTWMLGKQTKLEKTNLGSRVGGEQQLCWYACCLLNVLCASMHLHTGMSISLAISVECSPSDATEHYTVKLTVWTLHSQCKDLVNVQRNDQHAPGCLVTMCNIMPPPLLLILANTRTVALFQLLYPVFSGDMIKIPSLIRILVTAKLCTHNVGWAWQVK